MKSFFYFNLNEILYHVETRPPFNVPSHGSTASDSYKVPRHGGTCPLRVRVHSVYGGTRHLLSRSVNIDARPRHAIRPGSVGPTRSPDGDDRGNATGGEATRVSPSIGSPRVAGGDHHREAVTSHQVIDGVFQRSRGYTGRYPLARRVLAQFNQQSPSCFRANQ